MAQVLSVKNLSSASDFCLCIKKVFLLSTYHCQKVMGRQSKACPQALDSVCGAVPAACYQGTYSGPGCAFPYLEADDG